MYKKNKKNHWIDRSSEVIWPPCTRLTSWQALHPLSIERAEGVWLTDTNGNKYLDAISSWWVNLLGHANQHIRRALDAQFNTLDHVLLAGCTHEPAVLLADALIKKASDLSDDPERKISRCLFSSDGASAIESAMKLAVHYFKNIGLPQKNVFVGLQGGYHGETLGALRLTDIPVFRNPYLDLLTCASTLPVPDQRLCQTQAQKDELLEKCVQAAEAYLNANADKIAGLVIEPQIQCANQMTFYDSRYLSKLAQLCNSYQILLIADEIAVGMGRTGTFFASEHSNISPDILCLSKGLSGGVLPLSVTLVNQRVFKAFNNDDIAPFLHSHSFTGNPLACHVAVTVLTLLDQCGQLNKNKEIANRLTRLAQPVARLPYVRHFRHLGMIWAFDVDYPLAKNPDKSFSTCFSKAALQHGLLLRPIGNTVYWMPPYIINEHEMEYLAEGTLKSLNDIFNGIEL